MQAFFAKNKKWIIIAAIVLVVAIAAVVVLTLPREEDEPTIRNKRIDLFPLVTVVEDGMDTQGTLLLEFDYVAAAEALDFKEMDDIRQLQSIQQERGLTYSGMRYVLSELSNEFDLKLDELQELFNSFDMYVMDDGTFSNGDTATITIEVYRDAKYGKKIRGGEFQHEVKGLQELTSYFPEFECKFEGYNGSATMQCTITEDYQYWHNYITFSCDNDGYLSNGDEITITAHFDEGEFEYVHNDLVYQGYDLQNEHSITITVSGLVEPLTASNCTDAILDQAEQIVKEDTVLADPELVAQVSMVYFAEGEDESHIVVALEFPDEAENRVWNHIRYLKNVRVDADGNLLHDGIWHVLSGNGFDAAQQEAYILEFGDFSNATLTKLR